jgi:hypothetical protein
MQMSLETCPVSKLIRSLPQQAAIDSSTLSQGFLDEQTSNLLAMVEDGAIMQQHRLLTKLINEVFPVCKQAIILLKVWLTQSSLRFGCEYLDAHGISLLVCYLLYARVGELKSVSNQQAQLKKHTVSSSSGSTNTFEQEQHGITVFIFQNVLEYLSSMKLNTQISMDFSGSDTVGTSSLVGVGSLPVPALCSGSNGTPGNVYLLHPLTGKRTGKQLQNVDTVSYNCLWRVSNSAFEQLQMEARKALHILKTDNEFAFKRLFLDKSNFFQRYDMFLRVSVTASRPSGAPTLPAACGSNYVQQLCLCALGSGSHKNDRIRTVGLAVDPPMMEHANMPTHALSAHSRTQNNVVTIHIGLVLNSENINRKVDRGPAATAAIVPTQDASGSAAVSTFQQFWGEKCQLRRFQDGSIVEAVVWDDLKTSPEPASDKKRKLNSSGTPVVSRGWTDSAADTIPERILNYVLQAHSAALIGQDNVDFGASLTVETSPASRLDLQLPEHTHRRNRGRGSDDDTVGATDNEEADDEADDASVDPRLLANNNSKIINVEGLTRKAIEALDQLRDILTSKLQNLPLNIASLMSACPELRYTALYPAVVHPFIVSTNPSDNGLRDVSGHTVSLCVQTLSVFATLESSGKWALDAEARENSRAAFHFRIADLILEQFKVCCLLWECLHSNETVF